MKKVKFILLIMCLLFSLCLVGCDKANNSLKERKCAQLDKVFEELDYKEYSLNDWNLAKNYIKEGKSKIMLCNENNQIDKIYDETISKIYEMKSAYKFNVLDFKEVIFNGNAKEDEYKKIHIIDNYNELIELFSNEDIFYRDDKKFVIDNYTSDFFRDKTIVVYFYYGRSSNIKRYINEVSKYNNHIKIQMNCEQYGNDVNDDVFIKPIILEFNKNDISLECNIELYEIYTQFKK